MRIGTVIGSITLSARVPELPAGSLLLVQPEGLEVLRDAAPRNAEPVVALDHLSAGQGERVGLSEGREAAMPFHPTPVPIDAYCAAILDSVKI